MPRTDNKNCQTCTRLYEIEKGYTNRNQPYLIVEDGPRLVRESIPLASIKPLLPNITHNTQLKRLYVRDANVNRPVGYICPNNHVTLDEPCPIPNHVKTPTYPTHVICTATGDAIRADASE